MSLTLNMVGGGGGGLKATDALLRVQAPANSTVTITKGTTTKTDLGHENALAPTVYDYYFIIHQSQFDSINAWTVTATLGTSIATDTIIIDAADEYDIIMSYHVPPEYQEVEYLQSTGSQYINANYTFANYDKLHIIGQMTALLDDNTFFEVTTNGDVRCLLYGTNTGVVRFNRNGNYTYSTAFAANTDLDMVIDGQFKINNTAMGSNYVSSQSRPVFIFAGNDIGSVKRFGRIRIKYFKITNSNDVVRREFYPCYRRSDSVAGLWDRTNEVFYTNAGSGSFIVGDDV